MKMLIAGAGPAGLYLAYLVKHQLPGWSIRIVEQNPRDSTFGVGVVFSDRALEFLRGDDAETFVSNEHGSFNAHHYRHSAGMSTFVVECDPATWGRAGFAAMDEAATLAYCERVFADTLAGHRLVSNKSVWRNFPNLRNARWSAGNTVLLGDAQRTAHFSIGSGTRLAMED